MNRLKILQLGTITAFLIVFLVSLCPAEDYKIGPADVLSISFWQDPSLNQVVKVRQDGKITISVIGEITAAGMTPPELARKIGDQVSRYNRNISQATVEVLEYNSNKVFITGEIMEPGKYAFEVIPTIWELIKEAGGVTPQGDLSNIVIIRGSKNKGEIIKVNLAQRISEGNLDKVPDLFPEDIVEVKRAASSAGPGLPSAGTDERKSIIYVIGHVNSPGPITYEPGMEAMEAIALAGGPVPSGDLGKVRIFNKQDFYSNVITLDLEKRTKKGTPPRYKLKPEDTIYIPGDTGGFWGTSARIRDFIAVFGTVISTYLLVDRISD
jgi:polysaccharide biosynthesis/export protein